MSNHNRKPVSIYVLLDLFVDAFDIPTNELKYLIKLYLKTENAKHLTYLSVHDTFVTPNKELVLSDFKQFIYCDKYKNITINKIVLKDTYKHHFKH